MNARVAARLKPLAAPLAFAVLGALVMAYLLDFEITSTSKYHRDLTQSPHWVAYHNDFFPADDLLVRYGAYNESPLQNALYWVGTLVFQLQTFNKLVACGLFGVTAALFFVLLSRIAGARVGVLAASFFMIFPRSSYEIAGGFSKAWAIGLVLSGVAIVELRKWPWLLVVMPFAALAYPVSPVLIGAIVLTALVMEAIATRRIPWRELGWLSAGSALALVPLLHKYFNPPDFIGDMISPARMKEMWETGLSSEETLSLVDEGARYLELPIFYITPVLLFMLLARRGLVWRSSWTALVIASVGFYLIADALVPRLYVPDRYTRYSAAVLLVLWHAENWGRVLEGVRGWLAWLGVVALVGIAAYLLHDATFKPCDGDKALGRWEDRGFAEEMSAALAREPLPVLLAGHPIDTACVLVQARRPALASNRMFHPWFERYRAALDERHRAIIRATYARTREEVNALVETYGVTHLLVRKSSFGSSLLRHGTFYLPEYNDFVREVAGTGSSCLLRTPPRSAIVFEDDDHWLLRLPLE